MAGKYANVRYKNGSARRKIRARWKASGAPCALCGKPIDYSLGFIVDPRTGKRRPHPMSFVVDEIIPVSRYREGGFDSPEQAATTWSNTQPAHYICNARKGNKMPGQREYVKMKRSPVVTRSREW